MITITQTLSGTYFSANIPDVAFTITGYRAAVTITIDGTEIYAENLFPVNGQIAIEELDVLLTPYARQKLKVALSIKIEEKAESNDTPTASKTLTA